jgi:hypothetical protein
MVDAIIDRTIDTYRLMKNGSVEISGSKRQRLASYLTMLVDGGQRDPHRLKIFGLAYLRELDGSNDPVGAGFSGL